MPTFGALPLKGSSTGKGSAELGVVLGKGALPGKGAMEFGASSGKGATTDPGVIFAMGEQPPDPKTRAFLPKGHGKGFDAGENERPIGKAPPMVGDMLAKGGHLLSGLASDPPPKAAPPRFKAAPLGGPPPPGETTQLRATSKSSGPPLPAGGAGGAAQPVPFMTKGGPQGLSPVPPAMKAIPKGGSTSSIIGMLLEDEGATDPVFSGDDPGFGACTATRGMAAYSSTSGCTATRGTAAFSKLPPPSKPGPGSLADLQFGQGQGAVPGAHDTGETGGLPSAPGIRGGPSPPWR